jgi:hypothetical protein
MAAHPPVFGAALLAVHQMPAVVFAVKLEREFMYSFKQ